MLSFSTMTLVINGEKHSFNGGLTVAALIEKLGMKQDRVAVELNREIVQREKWAVTDLNSGDRLEIVHFVGGGNPDVGRTFLSACRKRIF
jgi:thiamine biosynthesis protein ThiS